MPGGNDSAGAARVNRQKTCLGQGSTRWARRDGGDAQALGSPPHVKANDVAFAQEIDARHPSPDLRSHYVDEGKNKFELAAAVRAQDTVAACTVEPEDHALVEIARKSFPVVFVGHA